MNQTITISNPSEDDKKIKGAVHSYKKNRGDSYISHVPHGFFEKQMGTSQPVRDSHKPQVG